MTHFVCNDGLEPRINEFADDIIDLWLKKYSDLEREGVVDTLLQILTNKDAKYYQLDDKEREDWFSFIICEALSGANDDSEIYIDQETQKRAIRTKFGYNDMCEDCKAEFDLMLEHDDDDDDEEIPL